MSRAFVVFGFSILFSCFAIYCEEAEEIPADEVLELEDFQDVFESAELTIHRDTILGVLDPEEDEEEDDEPDEEDEDYLRLKYCS